MASPSVDPGYFDPSAGLLYVGGVVYARRGFMRSVFDRAAACQVVYYNGRLFRHRPWRGLYEESGHYSHNPLSTPIYRAASKLRSHARLHKSDCPAPSPVEYPATLSDLLAPITPSSAFSPFENDGIRKRFTISRVCLPPRLDSPPRPRIQPPSFPHSSPVTPLSFPSSRLSPAPAMAPSSPSHPSSSPSSGAVQNFSTNWGDVAAVPAAGATVWGAVYSLVYEEGTREGKTLC